MAKMLWHNTMSLDGYVARPNDNMGWMQAYLGPNETVQEVLPQIGAILMGARTYRGVIANPDQAKPYGGAIEVPYLVLTHADPSTAQTGFQFLRGDMSAVVESAKAAAGDKYVAILGQQAGRAVLQAGLLDEILIHLVPTLLSDGVMMFESEQQTHDLAIKLCRQSRRVIDLWFTCQG